MLPARLGRVELHPAKHIEWVAGLRNHPGARVRRRLADQRQVAINVFLGSNEHPRIFLYVINPIITWRMNGKRNYAPGGRKCLGVNHRATLRSDGSQVPVTTPATD
jgi:hypothetical protein